MEMTAKKVHIMECSEVMNPVEVGNKTCKKLKGVKARIGVRTLRNGRCSMIVMFSSRKRICINNSRRMHGYRRSFDCYEVQVCIEVCICEGV